jgi:Restriction endonuclease
MKIKEIRKFVEYIFSLNRSEIIIPDEFEKYVVSNKKVTQTEAPDLVELNLNKVYNELKHKISTHENEFTTSKYVFSSYDKDKLIKRSLIGPISNKENIETKIKWREEIKKILKEISWRDFEFLAEYILESNNIDKDITITKSVNDQGIDFWGYFKEEREININRFQRDLKFRIVGQVKHSNTNVNVTHSKISSFGTELNRLRRKSPPQYFDNLSDEFFNSPLPIVGIFITNTDYLPKARDFSTDYGIIIWNGNQISEDLANPKFLSKIFKSEKEISLEKLKQLLSVQT